MGWALGGAGDVNNDGIADMLISDETANSNAGYTYVLFGKSSPWAPSVSVSTLNGSDGFRIDGVSAGDRASAQLTIIGDMNGDGIDDFAVSAIDADPGGLNDAGSVYVVFGKTSGWAAIQNLSTLTGSNGFRIDGVSADENFGTSISSAGDVNGDGLGDLIIGNRLADPSGVTDAGSSYVVFGKSTAWSSAMAVSDLNGTNGFRIDGVASGDSAGNSVSGAGDVNGDGFADLHVAAGAADPGGILSAGATYVIFGKATGWTATVSLSGLNGSNGFRLEGPSASALAGSNVAQGGDINRDGFADAIVGSYNGAYVVFGDATGAITRTGGSGGDFFGGGSFNDSLSGALGNDSLLGGAGFDTLAGGPGDDTLRGGTDNDLLIDGAGVNLIDGEGGIDTFDASSRVTSGTIDLLAGIAYGGTLLNVENAIGGTAADLIIGSAGVNRLEGSGGADTLRGGAGADTLDGGAGQDMASYSTASAAVVVFSASPGASTGDAAGDVFANVERWELTTSFNDTFFGDSIGETAFGLGGADVLFGNGGNDSLDGGAGDDFLLPGAGVDTIFGDAGFDAVFYGDATTAITLNLATGVHTGMATGDSFTGVEAFLMTPFGDRVTGIDNASAGDIMYGLGGNDVLIGQGGFDYLLGGDGDDTLIGGFGYDLSTGGVGADRFVFNNGFEGGAFAGGGEVITDFQSGIDKLAFVGASSGFTTFTLGSNLFIQAGGVTGLQGATTGPTLIYDSTAGALWFDSNGSASGGLNFLVSLLGAPVITATDFLVV